MKKGISTIIATIMLVVITIGLISTAYLYFSSIVTVGPVLSIASAYCNTTKHISVTLRNDGTSSIDVNTITWLKDGVRWTVGFGNCTIPGGGTTISAASSGTCVIWPGTSGVNNILAIGPKNQAGGPVTCT
jgi:FlaG/FlaF family flagellin (archaellin)